MNLVKVSFSSSLAILTLCCMSLAQTPATSASKSQLAHGRYLVQRVGLCGECHTPHDNHGQPVKGQELQGSMIPFKPAVPMPAWATSSPPLAGLPGFTDEQMITFLTTGKDTSGKFARPPMPPFRFNKTDAAAVTAYLRSLKK